jgi:hypothetical protein
MNAKAPWRSKMLWLAAGMVALAGAQAAQALPNLPWWATAGLAVAVAVLRVFTRSPLAIATPAPPEHDRG